MRNINTILILVGILSMSILTVENMVINQQAYVYIYYSKAWVLSIVSVVTGILIGFGIKGKLVEQPGNADDDSLGF